MLAKRSPGPCD